MAKIDRNFLLGYFLLKIIITNINVIETDIFLKIHLIFII